MYMYSTLYMYVHQSLETKNSKVHSSVQLHSVHVHVHTCICTCTCSSLTNISFPFDSPDFQFSVYHYTQATDTSNLYTLQDFQYMRNLR